MSYLGTWTLRDSIGVRLYGIVSGLAPCTLQQALTVMWVVVKIMAPFGVT